MEDIIEENITKESITSKIVMEDIINKRLGKVKMKDQKSSVEFHLNITLLRDSSIIEMKRTMKMMTNQWMAEDIMEARVTTATIKDTITATAVDCSLPFSSLSISFI